MKQEGEKGEMILMERDVKHSLPKGEGFMRILVRDKNGIDIWDDYDPNEFDDEATLKKHYTHWYEEIPLSSLLSEKDKEIAELKRDNERLQNKCKQALRDAGYWAGKSQLSQPAGDIRQFSEKHIKKNYPNATDREKTIIRTAIHLGYEFSSKKSDAVEFAKYLWNADNIVHISGDRWGKEKLDSTELEAKEYTTNEIYQDWKGFNLIPTESKEAVEEENEIKVFKCPNKHCAYESRVQRYCIIHKDSRLIEK